MFALFVVGELQPELRQRGRVPVREPYYGRVYFAVEGLGDIGRVVFLNHGFLVPLHVRPHAVGRAESGQVPAAPERAHHSVHALDEGGVGQLAARRYVDGVHFRALGEHGVELRAEFPHGVADALPLGRSRKGVCLGLYPGHSVALAVYEPVSKRKLLEHVRYGRGEHQPVAAGDEPFVGVELRAVGELPLPLENPQALLRVFKEPERILGEYAPDPAVVVLKFDFVDAVLHRHAVHHLAHEQAQTAGLVFVAEGFCAQGGVKVAQRAHVFARFRGVFERDDFKVEARDRLFAFEVQPADGVVARQYRLEYSGGRAEAPVFECFERPRQRFGAQVSDGARPPPLRAEV